MWIELSHILMHVHMHTHTHTAPPLFRHQVSLGGSVSANASGYQSGSSSPPESPDGESVEGKTLYLGKETACCLKALMYCSTCRVWCYYGMLGYS